MQGFPQGVLPAALIVLAMALLIFAGAFWVLFRYKTNPLYVMAGSGLLGLILYSL